MANAGALPPMICRGTEILKIRVEGVPLGLLDAREYEEVTFQAEAGDTIVLYSDGITDHMSAADDRGMAATRKNAAAVALGRRGGKKGGPARAAKLTPEQRSESARKAVCARWSKAQAAPAAPPLGTSKRALHLCLNRIKDAKDENELRRLTEELQRIVFHRQYQNAEN